MRTKSRPILCLDFDGVIHSYTSGWKGEDVIPDPPVPGAINFINAAMGDFTVVIHSSRFNHHTRFERAIQSMVSWLRAHGVQFKVYEALEVWPITEGGFPSFAADCLVFSAVKPPALVTIDDRAITFTGTFPDPAELMTFRPWNRKLGQGGAV